MLVYHEDLIYVNSVYDEETLQFYNRSISSMCRGQDDIAVQMLRSRSLMYAIWLVKTLDFRIPSEK